MCMGAMCQKNTVVHGKKMHNCYGDDHRFGSKLVVAPVGQR